KPRAYRPLGVVLMGSRIAEINQHAVAHVFRDVALEAGDDFGDRLAIGAEYLAQILWIETGGKRRRSRQIAKHNRQLPALGTSPDFRIARCRRVIRGQRLYRVEQPAAMTDGGDAEIPQIVDRQPP